MGFRFRWRSGGRLRHRERNVRPRTTDDARVRRLLDESFVAGYDVVLWVAAGLSVVSALSAAVLIEGKPQMRRA